MGLLLFEIDFGCKDTLFFPCLQENRCVDLGVCPNVWAGSPKLCIVRPNLLALPVLGGGKTIALLELQAKVLGREAHGACCLPPVQPARTATMINNRSMWHPAVLSIRLMVLVFVFTLLINLDYYHLSCLTGKVK